MRSLCLIALIAPLLSCVGPEASDAALCQDLVHRLCLAPRCQAVEAAFSAGEGCEQALLANTGCAADDFSFTAPTRARFLECRLPLVRGGSGVDQHPSCDEVSQALTDCEDLVRFLGGTP